VRNPAVRFWTGLNARDRRALRAGAAVLAAALFAQAVVRPYLSERDDLRARIVRERDLLAREDALLAAVAAYPRRLDRAEAALLAAAPRLFPGADLATASAELSSHVAGEAFGQRVFVQQSETRPPEDAGGGIVRLRVELRAMGDLEGILGMLHRLETGPKLLTVEGLSVRPAEPVNPAEGADEEVLALGAVVAGYALAPPKASHDAAGADEEIR
jgi:hypothetical protein